MYEQGRGHQTPMKVKMETQISRQEKETRKIKLIPSFPPFPYLFIPL